MSEIESTEYNEGSASQTTRPTRIWSFLAVLIFVLLGIFLYLSFIVKAPSDFPLDTDFVVKDGANLKEVARDLKNSGFVRSELALYVAFLAEFDPNTIKASTFRFSKPLDVFDLAKELTIGQFNTDLVKVTHIEGESVMDFSNRLDRSYLLPDFDVDDFNQLAKVYEGRLYPETYFVPKAITEVELLDLMLETYAKKISDIKQAIDSSQLTEYEILILASIIEREANDSQSMGMVSGILQNRLELGMPLQTDASLEYVLDKPLSELKAEDLKIDSPYNTYLYTGLPPTPIGNPGMEAIKSVLYPTASTYLFYITGNDGNFYYAEDFDKHRINIARHLR